MIETPSAALLENGGSNYIGLDRFGFGPQKRKQAQGCGREKTDVNEKMAEQ